MREVMEVNDADCSGICSSTHPRFMARKLTLGSNGRVELHEPISASSTNLTVPYAIRYPTSVDASRALVWPAAGSVDRQLS